LFAWQLPGRAEVDDAVGRVEKVSKSAGRQVCHLRRQLTIVRARQPELLGLARQLEKQMRRVSATVQSKDLTGDGLEAVSEALGQIAGGLDALATTLDPKGIGQIGQGLGGTADYLDEKVLPAAEKAAGMLEKAGATLKDDAARLGEVLREAPPELKAARAVVDSLAKFEEGLERMSRVARMDNLEAMREGFKGMESSLQTGADQVEKLSNYTIPRVTGNGLRVTVEPKEFWPEGKTIAEGMRKAAKGCKAAGKELDAVRKELPGLRSSLEHSRKVVSTTRNALQGAIGQQEKLEPVLKSLPRNLARLAEELPRVTADLARVLRETARLKEVSAALRHAEKGVAAARARWPQLRDSLAKSAVLLRNTQKELDKALDHREDYETTVRHAVELTELFARSLPVLLEQMEEGLGQQEQSLGELGDSIDRVSAALPAAAETASRLLRITRWLLCLVALAVAAHGLYQLGTTLPPK
jgi:ABC-type transporter Mla subunit MlaD